MKNDNTIESQIASVLSDIHQKGYSSVQPFSIGKVEERMMQFAQANNYKMKISRELVANVNFITATRVKDPAEFTLPKYLKI